MQDSLPLIFKTSGCVYLNTVTPEILAQDVEGVVHVCRLLSSALMVALSLSNIKEESRCVNLIKYTILW